MINIEEKNMFAKLIGGDFSLSKTYWLFGVLVGLVFNITVIYIPSMPVILCMMLVHFIYYLTVMLSIWRAASRYEGIKFWSMLAKVSMILGAFYMLASIAIIAQVLYLASGAR